MAKKVKLKLKSYDIISEAVERGIVFGLNHATKHTDNPTRENLEHHLNNDVMIALSEVIDFE